MDIYLDENTSVNGNKIIYNLYNNKGDLNIWPGVVGNSPVINLLQFPDNYNEEKMSSELLNNQRITELYSNPNINPWNTDFLYSSSMEERNFMATFNNISKNMINDILFGRVSISDGMTEYNRISEIYNINQYIDELNSLILN